MKININLLGLALLIFIIAIFGGLSISNLNTLAQRSLHLIDKSILLKEIEAKASQLNFFMEASTIHSNFDKANKRIRIIKKDLDELERISPIVKNKNLQDLFAEKEDLISQFIAVSSQLHNAFTTFELYESQASSVSLLYIIVSLKSKIASLFLASSIDENDINTLRQLLKSYQYPDDKIYSKFSIKAESAFVSLITFRDLKKEHDRMGVSPEGFSNVIKSLLSNTNNELKLNKEAIKTEIYLLASLFGLGFIFVFSYIYLGLRTSFRNSIVEASFNNLDAELVIYDKNLKPILANAAAKASYKRVNGANTQAPFYNIDEKMLYEANSTGSYNAARILTQNEQQGQSYFRMHFADIFHGISTQPNYLLSKINISKETRAEQKIRAEKEAIQRMFDIDNETGLGSLSSLNERLGKLKGDPGTLIYVNIKDFINLRFSYNLNTISYIINSVASSLRLALESVLNRSLKPQDMYHIYLDEFCIWSENKDLLQKTINMLLARFSQPFTLNAQEIEQSIPNLELCFGVSTDRDQNTTNRLSQAILACQEAIANDEAFDIYRENLSIEEEYKKYQQTTVMLKNAIALSQNTKTPRVFLEFQGIHNAYTRDVEYYECLVRVQDDSGKIWYPGQFLDVAKKSFLYLSVTSCVINQVFELLEHLNVQLSINLSSIDMLDKGIQELFSYKLAHCPRPQNLCIEVLESEGVSDYESIKPMLKNAKAHGCKISIDDFGSGFSNYYRLLEIDLDYLKIDGSIIKELPYDENARKTLSSIVDFANSQNYGIVAEFVCDNDVLREVKKLGITLVQGYEFSKPKRASEVFAGL